MKKIKSMFLIIVSIFLIICQLNSTTYAYTINEVKGIIGFKVIEAGNEPEYDIKIDAKDMISNEKLPCIKTTIESVLYSSDGLLNVNFLNKKTSSEKKWVTGGDESTNNSTNNKWSNNHVNHLYNESTDGVINQEEYISDLVKIVFKVSLALSIMAMLTLLIYIGFNTVSDSVFANVGFFKFLEIFKNKNPQKQLKQKKAVEQWFKSMVLMSLLVLIINFVTGGVDELTKILDEKKVDTDSIGVYVVNSKKPQQSSSSTTMSSNSQDLNDITTEGTWGIYAKNLNSNKDIENYNENEQMSSASVMKLFIAAAAYQKQAETGENASTKNIIDKVKYNVDESAMKKMITISDNAAANSFIDTVGMDYINEYLKKNDYTKTKLNRKFIEKDKTELGLAPKDNLTSARDLGRLLEKIYSSQCEGADKILNYMKNQTRTSKIPAGVPSGIEVANKTGETPKGYINADDPVVENDAAIVYKQDNNYVLVVLSSGVSSSDTAVDKIKQISERIYAKVGGASEQAVGTGTSTSATSDSSLLGSVESKNTREKIVQQAKTNDGLGAGMYQCEVWVEQVYRNVLGKNDTEIPRHLCAHEAGLTSNNGVGPYTDSNNIIPGAAVFSYKSQSGTTCGDHDAGHIGIYIGDGKIASWLGSSVGISTIEDWKRNWNFDGWGWINGTESLGDGAGANDISSSGGQTFNYFFKTGTEGLLMFKSQYNWDKYAGRNFSNMIGGISIAIIKIFLYAVFFIRMVVLALITAFSPIIILIDTFKIIAGSKGYFKSWCKLYLFMIFLRPVISFVYYVFVQSNPYLAVQFPEYVVIVNIVIFIITLKSIKMLLNDLRDRKTSNKIFRRA